MVANLGCEGDGAFMPLSCRCDVAQPTVSHHLKVLREAGWIAGERRGTWIWYSIRPEALARFREIAGDLVSIGSRPVVAGQPPARRLLVVQPQA